ncbi:unnamed protein product [Ambrosiozyma monospora]|uniref:Unnamed protein product n=1 Tax=Ambrosiozyma monospora TaxID=43982 RepID=A0ACB5U6L9_AMBMO|nr:unnamed protein product [Ambrosiozyma monospora]
MRTTFYLSALLLVAQSAMGKKVSVLNLAKRDTSQQQQQGQQQQGTSTSSASSSSSSGSSDNGYSDEYGVLQFQNYGYAGSYYKVKSMDLSDSECTCELDKSKPYDFSGAIAPLNEEVSIHIRGPLNLQKMAFYTADSYTYGSTSGSWSRQAYYDSSAGTADNVTFLGNVGTNYTCVGKALNYVDSDGLTKADSSTVLGNVTLESDEEFAIYSSVKCGDSGWSKDCGVYRKDIDAYHGFYGTTKMFLFQFRAPLDTTSDTSTTSYDMPAIWLLNANIARTSQYPTNANCSSWRSGGGEFDIFEVMNKLQIH